MGVTTTGTGVGASASASNTLPANYMGAGSRLDGMVAGSAAVVVMIAAAML